MHMWINNMTQESNKYSTEIRKGGSVLPCDVAARSGRLSWVSQVRGCRIGAQEGWTWSRSVGRAIRQGRGHLQEGSGGCRGRSRSAWSSKVCGQGLVLIPVRWEASEGEGDMIQCVLIEGSSAWERHVEKSPRSGGTTRWVAVEARTSLAPSCWYWPSKAVPGRWSLTSAFSFFKRRSKS